MGNLIAQIIVTLVGFMTVGTMVAYHYERFKNIMKPKKNDI